MHFETKFLRNTDHHLLAWVSENLSYSDFLEVVDESVKWGPAPNLKGQLYKVNRTSLPPISWQGLTGLKEWGAGFLVNATNLEDEHLIADAAHLERILLAIKKLKDLLSDDTGNSSGMKISPVHHPIHKKRHRRNPEDDQLEPR